MGGPEIGGTCELLFLVSVRLFVQLPVFHKTFHLFVKYIFAFALSRRFCVVFCIYGPIWGTPLGVSPRRPILNVVFADCQYVRMNAVHLIEMNISFSTTHVNKMNKQTYSFFLYASLLLFCFCSLCRFYFLFSLSLLFFFFRLLRFLRFAFCFHNGPILCFDIWSNKYLFKKKRVMIIVILV